MEHSIDVDNTPEQKKATVRAWLYQGLATLEVQDIEEATKYEGRNLERIEIIFKC